MSVQTEHQVGGDTVSEGDGFARRGGAIGGIFNSTFYSIGNKVRFEINPANRATRRVKMSSQVADVWGKSFQDRNGKRTNSVNWLQNLGPTDQKVDAGWYSRCASRTASGRAGGAVLAWGGLAV